MRRCFGTTVSCRTTVLLPPFSSSICHPLLFCPLFGLAPRLIHSPPCCILPKTYFFHTFFIPLQYLFLLHRPLSSPLLAPLIVPQTQSLHFYIPSSAFLCLSSILLCFPLLLHLTSSTSSTPPTDFSPPPPLNSPFWCCVFPLCFTLFAFSHIPVFIFSPILQYLLSCSHTVFHLPFLLLLSASPRLGLMHNHNFIAFPLKLCSHTRLPPPVSDFCCHRASNQSCSSSAALTEGQFVHFQDKISRGQMCKCPHSDLIHFNELFN